MRIWFQGGRGCGGGREGERERGRGEGGRAVQNVKARLKKTHGNLDENVYGFLRRCRVTPQSTTVQNPSDFVLKTPS